MMSCFKLALLLNFVCLCFFPAATGNTAGQSEGSGYRLLIYYGTPQAANGTRDDAKAAEVFATYDVIVFGAGLEEPDHPYHKSTENIFRLIGKKNKNARLFGYVDLGVTTSDFSQSTLNDKIKKWKSIGADGIFLDDAGYDYGVSRARLNETVRFVHELGLSAFINAWKPDDVMSSDPHPEFNPNGEPTALDHRDIYLLEDFLQPTDIFEDNSPSAFSSSFRRKMDKALYYRSQLGVKLMSVSDIDYAQYSDESVRKFFRMNEATAGVFALDAYGVSPLHYSSEHPGRHEVRKFPYIANYGKYITHDVAYTAKYEDRDFARGGFRIHSLPGEHYYNYPEDTQF